MVLMTEIINITSLEKNKEALIRSKAKVIFFQEHKVRKMEVGRIKKEMKDRGWMIHFGPANEEGKTAEAGVGVMWKGNEVQIFPERIKDEELQKTREQGRAGKKNMDVGCDISYAIYPIYGKSGGSKEAVAATEAILQATKREIKGDKFGPVMVVGDFNKEPSTLHTVRELKKEENWVDVGEVADWWGETSGTNVPQREQS